MLLSAVSPVILVIFVAFALSAAIQLFYNYWFYLRVSVKKGQESGRGKRKKPVSVIICARNEAANLEKNLPLVMEQDYPDFEVIVVNDCSEDETEEVLKIMEKRYPALRISTIHKDSSLRHSKKMALFIGIKAAKNELLLLTDADCYPESDKWIRSMTAGFSEDINFVVGYGGYLASSSLLNRYIRYDTAFIAMQYLGMAKAGVPYMGVGRNLAYRRSAFFDNRGFGPHLSLQSGDDDLFVNALARGKNCYAVIKPESFTRSVPSATWEQFSKQKMRHMSTSGLYRSSTKMLLMIEPFSRMIFYVTAAILISGLTLLPATLAIFGATFFSRIVVTGLALKTFREKDLFLFSPLFDILSPLINTIFLIGSRANKRKNYEWK